MPGDRSAHLVLDLDDTLVATFGSGWRKCQRVAAAMGLPPPDPDLFARLYGAMPFDGCVMRLHPGVDVADYRRRYDALADAYPPRQLGDVAAAVSAAAAAGFRLGLLTNGPANKTRRKLAALGLSAADFEFVRDADSAPTPKPSPQAFLSLSRDFGVCLRRSWYVSDQPADWLGSSAAGMRTAGVVSGAPPVRANGVLPLLIAPSLSHLEGCLPAMLHREPTAPPAFRAAGITTISFDAGFTLIEHVRSPEEVLAAITDSTPRQARQALAACSAGVSGRSSAWCDDASIHDLLLRHYREVIRSLDADGELAAEVVAAYTRPENWRAVAGATYLLQALARMGKSAVVLSNWQSSLPEVLAHAGISVDASFCSATLGVAKPDPRALGMVAQALRIPMKAMAHWGDDALHDGGAALGAGCCGVLMDTPASAAATTALRLLCSGVG